MHPHLQPTRDVLVVDDDYAIREMLIEVLEDAGYQVTSAENGQQAMALLQEAPALPCVILLDLMMPVMSGWAFREAQQSDPKLASIPVVVLSARPGLQHDVFMTTVSEFLQKPVDMSHLLRIVERYCR